MIGKRNMAKMIFEFPVLWEGWDCDSTAWVMEEPDGTRWLMMTNHGDKFRCNPAALAERIAEYERVIGETRKAMDLLHNRDNR